MAQILDLSKRFTSQDLADAAENDSQYEDVPAGGYVCKVIEAILVDTDKDHGDKHNITLRLDIAEGNYKDYFQKAEDRSGYWFLNGYMSFKKSQINKFLKVCTSFNASNPGYSFDPMRAGGSDVDSLNGKFIGVILGKEEYTNKNEEVKEKSVVTAFTSVDKIKAGKFKVPELKKIERTINETSTSDFSAINVPEGSPDEIPFG